jgi:hypothetical protein
LLDDAAARGDQTDQYRRSPQRSGVVEVREGANHTVYSLDGLLIPIARHSEIDNQMAEIIYKECAAKLGRGWWRR